MRDNKTKVITIAALVVAIIALSIGFAAFGTTFETKKWCVSYDFNPSTVTQYKLSSPIDLDTFETIRSINYISHVINSFNN